MRRVALVVLLALTLAACREAEPSERVQTGAVLLDEPFDDPFAWEQYADPAEGVAVGVVDDVYRVEVAREGFIWGLNTTSHTDVVIEVETAQLTPHDFNAFGVMCRADPTNNGDGYYFLISGDGTWSIRRISSGRGEALVPFTRSAAINRGRSINVLRVVCVSDYLALSINGEFAGETRDSRFSSGFAGLVASTAGDEATSQTVITFDNVEIRAASLVTPPAAAVAAVTPTE